MRGWGIKEIRVSSRGMYIRSTLDILLKWKDIRNADIIPNWGGMRSIADIIELHAIIEGERLVAQILKLKEG